MALVGRRRELAAVRRLLDGAAAAGARPREFADLLVTTASWTAR